MHSQMQNEISLCVRLSKQNSPSNRISVCCVAVTATILHLYLPSAGQDFSLPNWSLQKH